jgi:protein PhnA
MSIIKELEDRSGSICELCGAPEKLMPYNVEPNSHMSLDNSLLACPTCIEQIDNHDLIESNHWRCLNESMWSEYRPVQIMAWRMLNRLRSEGWPQDLLDMLYLDDEALALAKATEDSGEADEKIIHRDVNGVILEAGDSVVLIKDLKVKGSSMVAKQGTAVRKIILDQDNENYIEGKVDGQTIVIITEYVKKI